MKSFKQFFSEIINEEKHPIVKEYDALKKHDIDTLRSMAKKHGRVVDVSGLKTKDHAITHILRAKHGDKKVDQAFGLKEEVDLDEAKLERNVNTVGSHHLERDSGDHKMYTAYTGSLVRRLHTVTDKDDNILGQGLSAASAMAKAKLKKAHRDALMHDDNQIVKVHDTRGGHNVGTQVSTPGKGKWFKDHEEALKYAKSLPGKIRHADEKGHVYSESLELDEATTPKFKKGDKVRYETSKYSKDNEGIVHSHDGDQVTIKGKDWLGGNQMIQVHQSFVRKQ